MAAPPRGSLSSGGALGRGQASPAGPETFRRPGDVRRAQKVLAGTSLVRVFAVHLPSFGLPDCPKRCAGGRRARRAVPQLYIDAVPGAFLHAGSAAGS